MLVVFTKFFIGLAEVSIQSPFFWMDAYIMKIAP